MTRFGHLGCALALVFATGPLLAQSGALSRKLGRATLERQLQTKQQELAKREAEVERGIDILIRYHLGITVDGDRSYELTENERVRPKSEVESEVAAAMDAVSHWNRELEQLRQHLSGAQESATEQTEKPTDEPSWAINSPPSNRASAVVAAPHHALTIPQRDPAADHAMDPESEPVQGPAEPPVLIRGTVDHGHLGRAFFLAGMYEKARQQLERYEKDENAPLLALFYLARTYEKLDDAARADGTFLRIEALDDKRGANGTWASAARTARQHMNWMRDHGEWRPPSTPAKGQ